MLTRPKKDETAVHSCNPTLSSFGRVGVSQGQLFSRSISLASEKFWFIFRLIRSLIDPTYPLLITYTLYSHFIVRLRVSPNRYKMHCYWTLISIIDILWHFNTFALKMTLATSKCCFAEIPYFLVKCCSFGGRESTYTVRAAVLSGSAIIGH